MQKLLDGKHVILASNSPRRRELLAGLDLDFEVKVLPDIDESYPKDLPAMEVSEYISQKKADAYKSLIGENDVVITADTVVICEDEIMGKPHDAEDARRMLRKLSNKSHQVTTGVCITTLKEQVHFSVTTHVSFKELTDDEIDYYITTYKPFDKAGAYGIQEWIGYIGCTGLEGSYYNVMGLPVQRIYRELLKLSK
ncbi:Maf-like protein [Segatella albensis]|uniref:Maf-like protein n=1 Tax=Segatella albensis TaxID=77768 RepID=UPI00055B68C0|nr:Maf-like protein [Segatella albensis]